MLLLFERLTRGDVVLELSPPRLLKASFRFWLQTLSAFLHSYTVHVRLYLSRTEAKTITSSKAGAAS